eukprot:CAMPEP_0170360404 /NCGR_PEP_ID=MMETSP0117_2-20130122/3262_1 /TAXON_ID=400756 /ORGANISM="Durinskia baltica, Strain CSIRO CS-38" /LENGTH=71 /DNA_ID=CAMNT_0010614715 /DNA_START=266 /DNA_END=478 /DNA_ORIENTATION=+
MSTAETRGQLAWRAFPSGGCELFGVVVFYARPLVQHLAALKLGCMNLAEARDSPGSLVRSVVGGKLRLGKK